MSKDQASIRVKVDPTNPGQFFACCGLFELAQRMWQQAEALFTADGFQVHCPGTLPNLMEHLRQAKLIALEPDTPTTSPLLLPEPFRLRLDWWLDDRAGGSTFKTWAGQQKVVSIASAMQDALTPENVDQSSLLNNSGVLYDAEGSKVEPFYLDARRAAQSHSLDVGFSPDAQKMRMPVFSAVEFLCLVGLQRFRPAPVKDTDRFEYALWHIPLPIAVAAAVTSMNMMGCCNRYQFELLYRTKYLKGFLPAISVHSFSGERS